MRWQKRQNEPTRDLARREARRGRGGLKDASRSPPAPHALAGRLGLRLAFGAMEEVVGWKLSVCSVRSVRFARSSRLGGGFQRSPCPGFLGSAQGSWELPGSLGNFARELKPTRASSSSRGPASKKARGNGPGFLGIARGGLGTDLSKVSRGPLRGSRGALWASRGGLGASWSAWGLLGFLDASRRFLGASWGILKAS